MERSQASTSHSTRASSVHNVYIVKGTTQRNDGRTTFHGVDTETEEHLEIFSPKSQNMTEQEVHFINSKSAMLTKTSSLPKLASNPNLEKHQQEFT